MKLWTGRFKKAIDKKTDDYNSSLPFDIRLYNEDIEGSVAHAGMLAKQGIISEKDLNDIISGLSKIKEELKDPKYASDEAEDVHSLVEGMLTEMIGDAGKRLHTARSRNDQVALDLKLNLRKEANEVRDLLTSLVAAIVKTAKENTDTVMSGYTHLQKAQPVTFAHHVMAYAQMFKRDITRIDDCIERMSECPLGAGALASTTHPIDRFETAKALGFKAPMANSMDAVSDRDYVIELTSCFSIIMMHLSRFSEEIILWCSGEFRYIELDDGFSTGSSIMPQKKNPDIAELCRGKTGRVYGDLMALLTVMKGIPLAYNKDMQEDKESVFDAVDTVKMSLSVFTDMFATMKVNKEEMRKKAADGFINATDCADYLAKKGVPFRDAYRAVGELVRYSIDNGKNLESLTIEEYKGFSPVFEEDIYDAISLERCVNGRRVYGGPAGEAVAIQIEEMEKFLGSING
ncbi:MAG: argininosuccinate lyase [Clostridia bacterium]|nr:argininosuccinate lyase [Clostridia bacterium]MBQ3068604.1 argininosuccinate lyase [Clostridia bacterium]